MRGDRDALATFANADGAEPFVSKGLVALKLASKGAWERVATLGALRECVLSLAIARLSTSALLSARAGLIGRGNLGRGRKGRRRGGALDALVCS